MPLLKRSSRRLSWLSINIVLNIVAASVIALYPDTLEKAIVLAVFLPIISDMSGFFFVLSFASVLLPRLAGEKKGIGMKSIFTDFHLNRIVLVVAIVVGAHIAVIAVRAIGTRLLSAMPRTSFAKIRSLAALATSFVIFGLYFTALGLILSEFGVSLKAYLASASVLGLAIGFGSQGLVQDVVTGLTLIFSDLINLDDMVEISGQTGLVQQVGMRFTVLKNHLGAEVYIPNRTIGSVINYPRGYVRCLVDTTLSNDAETADRMTQTVNSIVTAAFEQFTGIFITPPSSEGQIETNSGRTFLRTKFRIWPGRGSPLETGIKPEIVQALKQFDPAYSDWMVSVNYEVEKKEIPLAFRDFPREKK